MGSREPSASSQGRGWRVDFSLAAVIALSLALAPRTLDGLAALQWTRYYAARGGAGRRAGERAEKAGRAAASAIERLAPLPLAAEAARLAFDLGGNLEPRDPAAAAKVYAEVGRALDRARLRGLGLGGLAAEARRREASARTKLGEGAAQP